MKLLLFATLCACAAIAAAAGNRPAPCLEPGSPSQPPPETVTLDPRTVDAATVEDLRRAGKPAVCQVEVSTSDLVQLCRDKGFDFVTFDAGSAELRQKAERLKLRVVDSVDRRTTSGS